MDSATRSEVSSSVPLGSPTPLASPVEEVEQTRREEVSAVVPPGEATGCPPPLAWQQVVREFVEQGTPWYLDRPRYRLQGRSWGTGRPLYFLNGMTGTHELFALLVYLLRTDFRCVLFDYPGSVSSGNDSRGLTLPDHAADVLAIADQIGDAEFDLYATSFGSLVGLQVLLQAPGRIGRALLQGAFAERRLSAAERGLIRLYAHLPGRMKHVPFSRFVQEHNHRRWFPPLDLTRWEFFLNTVGQTPAATVARRASLIRDYSLISRLGEIQTPVLLIRSEGEGVVPESCQHALEEGLPQAKTEHLHTTGHMPYLTHPHRVAKLVRSFLAREPGN